MTTGYVFRHEWQELMKGGSLDCEYEDRSFIDWDSVKDTPEQVMAYVREWKDGEGGSICKFTATLEEVASVLEYEEPFELCN